MKALVCADLHIDKNRRFEDTKDILRQMATYAIKNSLDEVWVLGDVYDRRRPYNVEKVLFHRFVKSLTDKDITVLIIPGNHDSGADQVSAVAEFEVLDLPNVRLLPNPAIFEVENGSIYVGHFLVNGAKLGPSDHIASTSDRNLEYVLKTKADLYLLGDVHKAQKLNTNPDVLYVGAPDRIDFGERNQLKGFTLVETSKVDIPRYTFIPLKTRHMVQYDITSIPEKGITPNRELGSIVKVRITCTKEEYRKINEADIRKEFEEAYSLTLEYNIIREDRVRQSNISEGATYEDAFYTYANVVKLDEETIELGMDIINDC